MNLAADWNQLFATPIEFIAFITGILSVALLLPTNMPRLQWTNWIASIISASIYLYLFYEWTLYGNAILQPIFVYLSVVGAWKWRGQLRGIVVNVKEIPITYARHVDWAGVLLIAVAAGLLFSKVLEYFGDAAPVPDGLILTISLAAIWLQLKKYVQCWFLWIIVDFIAVPLHHSQGKDAVALLYLLYMVMCFVGWKTWHDDAVARDKASRKRFHSGTPYAQQKVDADQRYADRFGPTSTGHREVSGEYYDYFEESQKT